MAVLSKGIIFAELELEPEFQNQRRYIAQALDYPVSNGVGYDCDEALEDLCHKLLVYFHHRRQRERTESRRA